MFEISLSNKIICVNVNPTHSPTPYFSSQSLLDLKDKIELFKEGDFEGFLLFNESKTDFGLGLDLTEVQGLQTKDDGEVWLDKIYSVVEAIKALSVPKVALINGRCFSFSLELCLACDFRIASSRSETKLSFRSLLDGLTPAFLSSHTLGELASLKHAMDLVLSTRQMTPYKARACGLVDEICPDPFLQEKARDFIKHPQAFKRKVNNWGVESTPIGRKLMYSKARSLIEEKTKGFYPSYFSALKAVYLSYDKDDRETKKLEKSLFLSNLFTWQTQNILYLSVAKNKMTQASLETSFPSQKRSFSVTGFSTSLTKFLEICTLQKLHFFYYCKEEEKLIQTLSKVHKLLSKRVSKKEFSNKDADASLARILARPEEASSFLTPYILCFGASHGPNETEAQRISLKYYCHYPNYPLLEFSASEEIKDHNLDHLIFLANQINVPIVESKTRNFGFEVLCSYALEAFLLHLEGNHFQYLKDALLSFGFKVSPFEAVDQAGLECFLGWLKENQKVEGSGKVLQYLELLEKKQFDAETQPLKQDPSLESLILAYQAADEGFESYSHKYPRDKITDRCVLRLLGRAAELLEEGVLQSISEANYAALAATGFPDFWGGPLQYYDTVGPGHMLDLFRVYEETYGPRFKARPLVEKKRKFFS